MNTVFIKFSFVLALLITSRIYSAQSEKNIAKQEAEKKEMENKKILREHERTKNQAEITLATDKEKLEIDKDNPALRHKDRKNDKKIIKSDKKNRDLDKETIKDDRKNRKN